MKRVFFFFFIRDTIDVETSSFFFTINAIRFDNMSFLLLKAKNKYVKKSRFFIGQQLPYHCTRYTSFHCNQTLNEINYKYLFTKNIRNGIFVRIVES